MPSIMLATSSARSGPCWPPMRRASMMPFQTAAMAEWFSHLFPCVLARSPPTSSAAFSSVALAVIISSCILENPCRWVVQKDGPVGIVKPVALKGDAVAGVPALQLDHDAAGRRFHHGQAGWEPDRVV